MAANLTTMNRLDREHPMARSLPREFSITMGILK